MGIKHRLIDYGQTPGARAMDFSQSTESFRDLLLRHRGRTGLSQRDLAARLGAGRRTVQEWEAGLSHPSAERLQALVEVLLKARSLTVGREAADIQQLWAAVLREAPRMRTPFDEVWLAGLLAERQVDGVVKFRRRGVGRRRSR